VTTSGITKCAIWARVSTEDQETGNQLTVLRAWAERRGLDVAAEFVTEDSAWHANGKVNGKGAEFDRKRAELIDGARLGHYNVVLIWALDRLSRRGPEDTLATLRRLSEYETDVWSHQESWLRTTTPELRELLVGIFAWLAKQENMRRSERTKAGLQRRKNVDGDPIGRQPGAADKRPRRRSGYVSSWEGPGGEARRAALAERNRLRAHKGAGNE
jgi:putative DNA-invertase from lambdoid prophage Rac